jgi:RNA-directed DNA polymerase
VSQGLERVREAAKQRKKERFTALLHHVTVDLLKDAYFWLKREAAPGVDGRTWQNYTQNLEANLVELHSRIHRGTYRALPSRRRYIPKPDGRQRPLGIAALEDKIVQRAVVEVLNTIYEEDFLGFSYGFRPGRGQHDVLDALAVGITRTKVNWIVDADIAGFFDAVSHATSFFSALATTFAWQETTLRFRSLRDCRLRSESVTYRIPRSGLVQSPKCRAL